jgi:diaminopropionate ammonia-lyase
VAKLLVAELSRRGVANNATTAELEAGAHREAVKGITVTAATDGNHGRSVAWGAGRFGCGCVIFVHETVSQGRRDAIARYGAEIRVVPGTYDDAVREAARTAEREGWFVVSDTSWPGYTEIRAT